MDHPYFGPPQYEKWQLSDKKQVLGIMTASQSFLNHYGCLDYVMSLSSAIEPFDRTLGQSEKKEKGQAFYRGAMAGFGLARELIEDDSALKDVVNSLSRLVPRNLDPQKAENQEFMYEFAETVLGHGHEALSRATALNDLLETGFIDLVEKHVDRQYYAKSGVGFGYRLAMEHVYGRIPEPESISDLIDGFDDIDFESELKRLNGYE